MGEKVEEEKKEAEGPEKEAVAGEEKAVEGGEKAAVEGGKEEETAGEGGEKKEDEAIVVVLKVGLHCEGCGKKVRRAVSSFEGVEKVKADASANKLTVTGYIDPASIREMVESKIGKKVELVSPAQAKQGKKADEKSQKKAEKPKEPVIATVTLKLKLHCQGCAHKIKRIILKNFDDLVSVKTDLENDAVTVTGSVAGNELASFLQEKLKRSVEVVVVRPLKKESSGRDKAEEKKGGGGGDKAEEKKDGGVEKGEKKETVAGGGGDGGSKAEVSKMEFARLNPYSTYYAMPMYNQSFSTSSYAAQAQYAAPPPPPPTYLHLDHGHFVRDHYTGYADHGYPLHRPHLLSPRPPATYSNNFDDRMFSDENPNACFVM